MAKTGCAWRPSWCRSDPGTGGRTRRRSAAVSGPIAVAMSGGVDSSVAAVLLKEQGHALVGVTLRMQVGGHADGISRARAVAERLGFAHHVLDCAQEFEALVLRPAWRDYAAGRTPSPCLVCNERIKFGVLLDWARGLGIERMATGHYARLERDPAGRPALLRGRDAGKEQSYFLAGLSLAQLERAVFPVGHLHKAEVRALARQHGLPTAEASESQDACLVAPGRSYADKLRRRFGAPARAGQIVNEAGQVVGEHDGIHGFTIGQRKGLPAGATTRRWVKAISAETGRVIVTSDPGAILRAKFVAGDASWIAGDLPAVPLACSVQIRYRHASAPATIVAQDDGGLAVALERPATAVTPGQAAVFYDGERVLGRGWIALPG
ncbi:MAG: tRNA 2-thiouridine(34) synthase MnmA [Deltaproteobacteria bacterium]|nr:tRNA 2-thiouridine(34) synthase MnmA [Deltaproteobacteria bacterium]